MILALRQVHRRIFIGLAVLIPAGFITAIAARRPIPVADSLPAALAGAATDFKTVLWTRQDFFRQAGISTRLVGDGVAKGKLAVTFEAPNNFAKPDLLVYWAQGTKGVPDALPGNSQLLGAFAGQAPLQLPLDAMNIEGRLILYSLADQEVVAVSQPFIPGSR